MSKADNTIFSIRRFLPEQDATPRWQRFDIATQPDMTILQGLHTIRERHDSTLAWRFSCRMGVCGSCAMVINGKPGLACNTLIHDVSRRKIELQPLWNFSVIKDLITDLGPTFERHRRLKPYVIRSDADTLEDARHEFRQTPSELVEYLQFSYCIKCCACVAACPTVATDADFPGPMPLTAAHRYNSDTRDDGFDERKAALAEQHGVMHCHYAGECSRVCPKGVDPARAIQLMKRDLVFDLLRRTRRDPAPPVAPPRTGDQPADSALRPPEFTVRVETEE